MGNETSSLTLNDGNRLLHTYLEKDNSKDLGSSIQGAFDLLSSPLSCNPGEELFAGFWCFPYCPEAYSPTAMLCWSSCDNEQDSSTNRIVNSGNDWHDDGLLCRKRLYDRGTGSIPDGCADGNRQMFVGMCYVKCDQNKIATTWAPTVCTQPCPPNTYEGGFANCTKINEYGRGGGNWGSGCPPGYDNFGLWCFRWEGFKFSGYNCPGGTYDPKTNPGGGCKYAPRGGSASYGINPNCQGDPIPVGSGPTYVKNGVEKTHPNYPFGNPAVTDGNGNVYSALGCYPDPLNPGSWLTPATDGSNNPQYYLTSYYPKWDTNSGCIQDPGSTTLSYISETPNSCKNLPNDPTAGTPGFPLGIYSDVPIPIPLDTSFSPAQQMSSNTNTRRAPQQSNSCMENWGTLCYPQCDVGYHPFACCICTPDCGMLGDHGATCHRSWYDRGVGKIPDACQDDDKIYQELLCYKECQKNYRNFCTTCTRGGCPYKGKFETPLVCSKDVYYRGPGHIAIPAVSGKLNSKVNVGALSGGVRQIILNATVTILCLLTAFFLFSTNVYLKSRSVKVNTKF